MSVQFPPSSRVRSLEPSGNDFNEKILKSELIIVILIKNFLNHDSPEINRLIMVHVTKKCWRPFTLTKDKLEREMSEIPGELKHS